MRIAPSILSADFANLEAELRTISGSDLIHVDVMDNHFVPNLTIGVPVVARLQEITTVPLDVHLMVERPESYFESFADAGAHTLTIHVEAAPHLDRQIARIRELGCNAGVALNPGTPLDSVREVAPLLDLLLIMTVNPGFGGQQFLDYTVDKTARARHLLQQVNSSAALEVDGGITRDTIVRCWRAGADTFVAGNAIFASPDPVAEIGALRAACGVFA